MFFWFSVSWQVTCKLKFAEKVYSRKFYAPKFEFCLFSKQISHDVHVAAASHAAKKKKKKKKKKIIMRKQNKSVILNLKIIPFDQKI